MWTKPDPKAALPLSAQIRADLLAAIVSGRVRSGERLPSVRGLAAELLVNPNTVAKVYRDLEREGLLHSRPGAGVDVAETALGRAKSELTTELNDAVRSLVARALEMGWEGPEVLTLVEAQLAQASLASLKEKVP